MKNFYLLFLICLFLCPGKIFASDSLAKSGYVMTAQWKYKSGGTNLSGNIINSLLPNSPSFAFDKTSTDLNGGVLAPGDMLHYQLNYINTGNDASIKTSIIDNIPAGTTYMTGSLKINGIAATDAAGDDKAEYNPVTHSVTFRLGSGATATNGGTLAPADSGTVTFNVLVATSCAILNCNNVIKNSGKILFTGQTSGTMNFDSSGVKTGGYIIRGPVVDTVLVNGNCYLPRDTLVFNNCPEASIILPWQKYSGYTFYAAKPFIAINIIDPSKAVTATQTYWAYFNSGNGCSDTVKINAMIVNCPDIDDDDDGIPDYVEFNNPLALGDANGNGIPNWNDPTYTGFIDLNNDNVNDNFDYGADADNDGIPNFYDTSFPGFVDTNNDGINDNSDADKDGIPNQYDLDSDNDGITDVVECYGVDELGDGVIDNYTDTDEDGLSQNVDGSNSGVDDSASGLGTPNFDGDALPNYLDLDSDNDGIPDLIEAGGIDKDNNGRADDFIDINSNGLADNYENATALLKTGIDVAPLDGRADNYPFKNLDRDFRPNAYDVDADGDGIVDVLEAGLPDANRDGKVDGTINMATNGWSSTVSAMATLTLRNTDGTGNPDYLDIDSDDDGIPDNIEAQATATYKLPAIADADGDGLATVYDNTAGFSGAGIFVWDQDGDGTPDYRDLDTDADGQPDIEEGNDFNLNGHADDLITLTGLDTDGDGLDNRFDSLNSTTNLKGTSYRMGTNGSLTGDPTPGSRTTVQKRTTSQPERDWRSVGVVLPVQFLNLSAMVQDTQVWLNWTIITTREIDHFEIERSIDNTIYTKVGTVNDAVKINEQQSFSSKDDISGINSDIIYYRIKVIGQPGEIKYSNVLSVKKSQTKTPVNIMPNPARDYVAVRFFVEKESEVTLRLIDNIGKIILIQKQKVLKGNNVLQLNNLGKYSAGVYSLQVLINDEMLTKKLVLEK